MRRRVCRLSRTTPGWLQLNISKQGFWDLGLGGTMEEQLGNKRRMPWELASSLLLQWPTTTRITNLWGRTMSSWDRRCNLSVDQWRAATDPKHTSWLRSSPSWVPLWTGRWEGSAWVQKRCMEQSRWTKSSPQVGRRVSRYGFHALDHQIVEKCWDVRPVHADSEKCSSFLFEQNPHVRDFHIQCPVSKGLCDIVYLPLEKCF